MHFLKELIETPILKDPAKQNTNIHRHFYRYSRGEFLGPALKIIKSSTRITLKSTHEYEDLVAEIVANTINEEKVEINGSLVTGSDISSTLNDLGFNWNLKKSTGKTKNYNAKIFTKVTKDSLLRSIEEFRKNSYYLISFNLNSTCKLTTKKKIPQPSKKKVEEDDVNKRIQFCTGIIKNSEPHFKLIFDLALPDFKLDLNRKWKNILITNNYKIFELVLPENVSDWGLKRILAIRKGKLFRTIDIDGEIIENQYSIVV
ncbi:MAG: hypothetical protein ACFFHD_01285 [Promethearchaeota archaeon]